MAKEINTQETLPDGADVTPADGGRNDSEKVVPTLATKLSQALGRTFKDDEAALSAVQETFKYVGWAGKVRPVFEQLKAKYGGEDGAIKFMEDQTSKNTQTEVKTDKPADVTAVKPDANLASEVESLKQTIKEKDFFSDNPEYKPYRSLIKGLGNDPEKVVQSQEFKDTYAKLKAHDDAQNAKSVIQSNPRIGQATDKMTKAREAVTAGKHAEAASEAIGAVLDMFES